VSRRRGGGRFDDEDEGRDDIDAPSRSRRTLRRIAWPLVLTVLVCVTFGIGVLPTRTYLERKQEVALAQQQVDNLTRENDGKQARVDQLQTDEEIEAIAREQYQLVMPGEEAYPILPPPQEPVQLPEGWPFDHLEKSLTPATP